MARNGFFAGLDIGTSSIKVLVAEVVKGELNVIGVSNVKSAGVKNGIIVDIEAAATVIKAAVEQAEEKAGVSLERLSVGVSANLLQIEPAQGMIPISSDSKEIRDQDVELVVQAALTKTIMPEREVVSLVPEEFIVDGFQGIRDPRGMMGTRLEMRGLLYTGPKTILHNLRKTISLLGLQVEQFVISPLSLAKSILNEGEREFGATVIDMGGGQTTIASMFEQKLQYTQTQAEGGDYVTQDISKVLQTSVDKAEDLKINFGRADVTSASLTEKAQVEVVGSSEPKEVTENYLAQIIEARLRAQVGRIRHELERGRLLEFPGGVVLTGGAAILPGVPELVQEVLGVNVKLFMPNQVGIRNPIFANVLSLVEYVGTMSEVDILAQLTVSGEESLRSKPIEMLSNPAPIAQSRPEVNSLSAQPLPRATRPEVQHVETATQEYQGEPKAKLGDRVRGLFGKMFD